MKAINNFVRDKNWFHQLIIKNILRNFEMSKQLICIFLAIGILTGIGVQAQNSSQTVTQIEKLLGESVNYHYGENRQKLSEIEILLKSARDPAERMEIEKIFSQMLLKPQSTVEFKEFICRQLWYLGTAQSVKAVSTLFTNEETLLWACYALVRNPSKEAEEALLNALKIVPQNDKSRCAVIYALGQRRTESAVNTLSELCADKNPQISNAAITALGEVGSEQAASVLLKLYDTGIPETKSKVAQALVECAGWLTKDGNKSVALKLYEKLYASNNELPIRQASLRGIVQNSESQGVDLIVKILKSDASELHTAAIGSINLLNEKSSLKRLLNSINDFSTAIQPSVINLLAEKKEKSLLPVAQKLAFSQDQQTRIAAIKALGAIGDESTVQTLVKIISSNIQPDRGIAITSLKNLTDKSCDREILNFLRKSDSLTKIELINVAMERNIFEASTELLNICRSTTDKSIQSAAFKALGQLGKPDIIPDIVTLIINSKNIFAREEAESAVIAVAAKIKETNQRSKPVLTQWNKAENETAKSSLLRIIGGIGDLAALEFLARIVNSQDQPVLQDVAIREIAQWQDIAAIPILERIYETSKNPTHRALAFRGCIRLLSTSSINPEKISETIQHYERAIKNAQNADERKLILAAMPNAPDIKTLQLVLPMLEDNDVKAEAAQAIFQISSAIWGTNPSEAKNALNKIITTASDDSLRKQALALIKQIDKSIAYITEWSVAGPYFKEGINYDVLFNTPFPPEENNANVIWRPIRAGTNPKQPYVIDLLKFFGGEQRVAYARVFIYSPAEQNARLEFGSDDGAKVWFNRKLIYSINVARPITPDSDKVNVTLQKGWNSLMLKITQNNQGWEFCVKLVKQDGTPIDNIKYSLKPE